MVSNKPLLNFLAFGNCLVDHSVKVSNHDILDQYKLKPNELGECSQQILTNIIRDVRNEQLYVKVHLGGSALNTCRLLNGIGGARVVFCGSVGVDDNGTFVKEQLKELGVDTILQTYRGEPTGQCVCLIHNDDRCCYANIGASKCFNVDGVLADKLRDILNLQERAVVYIEGFFLTERSAVCRSIIKQLSKRKSNVTLAVNLSAPYIVESNTVDVNYLFDAADIVFGNKDEFEVLAKRNGIDTLMGFAYSKVEEDGGNKTLVVTDGDQPIEIYSVREDKFGWEKVEVRTLRKQDIVDTTGAGDAFVAGFFHAFLQEQPIKDCANYGMEIAVKKLKNIGAHL